MKTEGLIILMLWLALTSAKFRRPFSAHAALISKDNEAAEVVGERNAQHETLLADDANFYEQSEPQNGLYWERIRALEMAVELGVAPL